MDRSEILINAFMAGIMVWIIRKYLNTFLHKRKMFAGSFIVWIIFFLYQFYAECGKGNGSIFMLFLNVLFIFLICLAGYYGTIRSKLLYTVLVCVIGALIEMVTYFCLQFLLQSHTFEFNSYGSVISKLLSIILVIALDIRSKRQEKNNLPAKYIALLLFVPASSVLIANNIFMIDNVKGSIHSMISFALLLFVNCFIFEICQSLYVNMEIERENVIFAQQLELISKHTKEQKRISDEQREFRHNLKNYCIGLKVNLESDNKEKALEMINKMMDQEMLWNGNNVNSGNDLVDSLLNYKIAIAESNGITFTTKILLPEKIMFIEYGDLSVILGNLIDNAIDAAKECKESDRRIDISLGMKKEEFVIVLRNTYVREPLLDKNGNFVTNKSDQDNHGFGISSVKKAVEKYEGEILFQMKDGLFEAIVIINSKSNISG